MNGGPSLAWASAVIAVGHAVGVQPIPSDLISATVGDWDVWLNNSDGERTVPDHDGPPLARFHVFAASRTFIAFALIDPAGGMFAGYSEDQFIADMQAPIPEVDRPQ